MSIESNPVSSESAVRERYGVAAKKVQPNLCCAVEYDAKYLAAIPKEVVQRDYGCGDPSKFVEEGDVVLDLGSGTGKICFIASQVSGPNGRIIGVDMLDEMLDLSRRAAPKVAANLGFGNVEFRRGRIQDLKLDLDLLNEWLARNPVKNAEEVSAMEDEANRLRREHPLVADDSVDLVVSNCVLNLVRTEDKEQLFHEIFRVLRRGGRIAISDIVCDEPVPDHLRDDPELWSGCISGAFEEQEFLSQLTDVGFYGIEVSEWSEDPFAVVEGIEFRSVTVTAKKGKEGECYEGNHAVIYRGPWKQVEDDDNHVLERGQRTAVCEKTFGILTRSPYGDQIVGISPRELVSESNRSLFDCGRSVRRNPRETKGANYKANKNGNSGGCC